MLCYRAGDETGCLDLEDQNKATNGLAGVPAGFQAQI